MIADPRFFTNSPNAVYQTLIHSSNIKKHPTHLTRTHVVKTQQPMTYADFKSQRYDSQIIF